jgi:hypothetical protein
VLAAIVVILCLATAVAVEKLWERAVSGRDLALLAGLYVPISLGVTVGYYHTGRRHQAILRPHLAT